MTNDQIQTLRGLRVWAATSGAPAVVESIDAALALTERRCGNCRHAQEVREGTQRQLLCMNEDALGSFKDRDWSVDPTDVCRLGWEAKA